MIKLTDYKQYTLVVITALVLLICTILAINSDSIYPYCIKDSWANNVRILGLYAILSLLFLSIGASQGDALSKLLFLILLIVSIWWTTNVVALNDFNALIISSWSLLTLSLTLTVISDHKTIFLRLPFLFFSLLTVIGSYNIINNN